MNATTTTDIDFANAIPKNERRVDVSRVGATRHGKPVDGWAINCLRDPDGPHGARYWWFTVADDGELLSCGDATIGVTNPPVQYCRREWMRHPEQWDRAAELAREMLAELRSCYVIRVHVPDDSVLGRMTRTSSSIRLGYTVTDDAVRLDYALAAIRWTYDEGCGYGDAVIVGESGGRWQVAKSAEPGAPIVATIERVKRTAPPSR